MASKFFHAVGIAATFALVAGSFFALATVKDRVRVVIADEETASRRGPDSIALLSADVVALRDDVRALHDGLETRLAGVVEALDRSAAESTDRSSADLARIRAALERLGTPRAAGESLPSAAAPAAAVERPDATPVAEAHDPALAHATSTVEARSPGPTKRFLSFELPSTGFAFDRTQRFAIVPSLSRVGFDAKSTLHDFSGVTSAVDGEFTTNLARPDERCGGSVRAAANAIDTGLAARNEAMRDILRPADFPEVRFQWSTFTTTQMDATAQRATGVVKGVLRIRDVARELAMPVTVAVDATQRVAIDGQCVIHLSDFDVRPPSKLGLISVDDEVTLWIALRARSMGASKEERQ